MPDLSKLDASVKALDELTNDIQEFSLIYNELAELQQKIAFNQQLLETSAKNINDISGGFKEKIDNYEKIINSFDKKISEINAESEKFFKQTSDVLEVELNDIKKETLSSLDKTSSALEKGIENLKAETTSFLNQSSNILEQGLATIRNTSNADFNKLRESNKTLFSNLEDTLNSKLEKHKSDIQVEIRNEGTQIQRGFENTINKNFNDLSKEFKSNSETLLNGLKEFSQHIDNQLS